MSENIIKVKYKPRRDTEENWKTNNPILLDGELAITSDRYNMYKIGDGVSTWNQLEYSSNILVCTKEEYETKNANGEIKPGTIVIISDDNDYANITVDSELSETSTNLVENQAITNGLKTNETKDNTVTFTSKDSKSVTAYEDIDVLTSGEKHSSIFNKISTMFKNIRYLYKVLGSTDISTINDGTVTNIVSNLNENKFNKVNVINSTVTTEEGYAADARQLNSSVEGTYANSVANEITALNESLDKRNAYYDYKNPITITISAEVLSSIGFKQIPDVLITPSKEGYNLIGYHIITGTYRIAPICITVPSAGSYGSLSIYVTDTYNSDSSVTAIPIYVENK